MTPASNTLHGKLLLEARLERLEDTADRLRDRVAKLEDSLDDALARFGAVEDKAA